MKKLEIHFLKKQSAAEINKIMLDEFKKTFPNIYQDPFLSNSIEFIGKNGEKYQLKNSHGAASINFRNKNDIHDDFKLIEIIVNGNTSLKVDNVKILDILKLKKPREVMMPSYNATLFWGDERIDADKKLKSKGVLYNPLNGEYYNKIDQESKELLHEFFGLKKQNVETLEEERVEGYKKTQQAMEWLYFDTFPDFSRDIYQTNSIEFIGKNGEKFAVSGEKGVVAAENIEELEIDNDFEIDHILINKKNKLITKNIKIKELLKNYVIDEDLIPDTRDSSNFFSNDFNDVNNEEKELENNEDAAKNILKNFKETFPRFETEFFEDPCNSFGTNSIEFIGKNGESFEKRSNFGELCLDVLNPQNKSFKVEKVIINDFTTIDIDNIDIDDLILSIQKFKDDYKVDTSTQKSFWNPEKIEAAMILRDNGVIYNPLNGEADNRIDHVSRELLHQHFNLPRPEIAPNDEKSESEVVDYHLLEDFQVEKKEDHTIFTNFKNDTIVKDNGKSLNGLKGNESEQAQTMIVLAKSKGWDLQNLNIEGSQKFKKEMKLQIEAELNPQKINSIMPAKNDDDFESRFSKLTEKAIKFGSKKTSQDLN